MKMIKVIKEEMNRINPFKTHTHTNEQLEEKKKKTSSRKQKQLKKTNKTV